MVRWPLLSGPVVHHSQYAQDGPNIKFPNVYGPQDDRTAKTDPGSPPSRRPRAYLLMIGAFRIIPHNSTSFHLFFFLRSQSRGSRLASLLLSAFNFLFWRGNPLKPA